MTQLQTIKLRLESLQSEYSDQLQKTSNISENLILLGKIGAIKECRLIILDLIILDLISEELKNEN